MVKSSAFALAIASVLPTFASAATCTNGLIYCGFNLEKKGHYREEIGKELVKYGFPITAHTLRDSVFTCGEGGNGWIGLIKVCNECVDGGSGKDDHCKGEHWGL